MYVCVCVYAFVYTRMRVCACSLVYTCVYVCMGVRVYMYVCTLFFPFFLCYAAPIIFDTLYPTV